MIDYKHAGRQLRRSWTISRADTLAMLGNMSVSAIDYYLNPCSLRQSRLADPRYPAIRDEMEAAGLNVIPYRVDGQAFEAWLHRTCWPQRYQTSYGDLFYEKALEHYVGAELLNLQSDDVLIDVAAANSPWQEVSERAYGCSSYALDLCYRPGIDGKKIGADATRMPLPDEWASKMALHCAFEMFEGRADKEFIAEAERVLKPGGRMVILPLYMHEIYYADSAPLSDRRGLDFQGARRVWRDDGHSVRFSRKYSVEAFCERVVSQMRSTALTIYYIENEKEIHPSCYLKFAALFEKPLAGEGHVQ